MRLLSGLLWFLYKIAVFYTFLVYALTYWTPSQHWLAGFIMMSLPVMLVFHLVFLPVWAFISPIRILTTLFVLALGFPFLARTFQFAPLAPARHDPATLTVLSYNVFSFALYNYQYGQDKETAREFGAWIDQQQADVLCLQEYFSRQDMADFGFSARLRRQGYRYRAFLQESHQIPNTQNGVAVFSKHPILSVRDTLFNGSNGLLQADILWQKDTVRIIDVHLYSMTLQLSGIVKQEDYEKAKLKAKYTMSQLRKGFEKRAAEVRLLKSWVADSPHPVIVCGDFNETPYGYVYGRLRRQLDNAFEEKGGGFGFTFNRAPYLIRIDHQFYDENKLELVEFKTLNQVPYSDHYPLVGRYVLK